MRHDESDSAHLTDCDEPVLAVVKAIVENGQRKFVEQRREIGEVDAVFGDVGLAFGLIPLESHRMNVVTLCRYVNANTFWGAKRSNAKDNRARASPEE